MASTEGDSQICDSRILSFARTMGHNSRIAVLLSQRYCIDSFCQSTDLVNLNQNRIGDIAFQAHLKTFDIRHKEIVTNELDFVADCVCKKFPAIPIIFSHTVFDRDNRVFACPAFPIVNHLSRSKFLASGPFEFIDALFNIIEFGSCRVESDAHFVIRFIASVFDSLKNHFDSLFVRFQIRSKAAFVTDIGRIASAFEDLLQVVEDFRTHSDSLTERGSADRHNHEFLEVHAVISMRTAIEDIHHWDRKNSSIATTDIAIEVLACFHSSGLSSSKRDAEDSICAQSAFIFSAVDFNHTGIEFSLVADFHTFDLLSQNIVHILDSLHHAFTHKAISLTVTQFNSFVNASRSARWNGSTAHSTSSGVYIDFNSGITTRV